MRNVSIAAVVLLVCVFWAAGTAAALESAEERAPAADPIEQATGLKKLAGDRFIIDLKYDSEDNFLEKNVYGEFGINACYVHEDVHQKLTALAEVLEERGLKLVLFDCYRPIEVQEAMWKILPDSRYVADPRKGSLHNRGVAVDCALADEGGSYLSFPTPFDSFEKKAWQSHVCPKEEPQPCENRETLKELMQKTGLRPINSEWWHFQLPGAKAYPILSIKKGQGG